MRDPEHLRKFAEQYAEAWCSHEPERVAAHFAPDGSLTINGGEPAVGRAAITEAARSFMRAFPDMRVLMDDLRAGHEATRFHWTLVGTNTGLGGSGNRVRISGFEEWTLADDGLIARSLGFFDEVDYERQLERGASS